MQIYEGQIQKPDEGDIVIVVAKFNRTITDRLLEGALAKLRECQIDENNIIVCRVPGAFEIPIVAARFAEMQDVISVICLGVVIKGETSHDEHINRAVSLEIAKIATDSGKPVIFGLLTCNTVEQAVARSGGAAATHDKTAGQNAYIGNKGYEAAEAALEMVNLMPRLPQSEGDVPWNTLSDMFAKAMMDDPDDSDGIYDTPFEFDDDDDFGEDNESDGGFGDWDEDDDDTGVFDDSPLSFLPRKKQAKRGTKKSGKKTSKKNKKKRK
ncbi:MAG: 6,7-dimethyl-8-ribityllumazine synthase [Planctomycetaceae bacterium]|nr:6,7-dimethyl-8-ribityllumazine synthase [Planctomycetaceae bacterium]